MIFGVGLWVDHVEPGRHIADALYQRIIQALGRCNRSAEDFGVYLLGEEPPEFGCHPTAPPTTQDRTEGWVKRWVKWPDFWLPADPAYLRKVLLESLRRSEGERVEFACGGGRGRTGTALACLAILDGVPAAEAVAYVRERYHPRAVETPWQKRFVRKFDGRR